MGIHLADTVEESDGDLMGDVNIAARLEGIAKPGSICLSANAFRQVRGRLDLAITDLGPTALKNIAKSAAPSEKAASRRLTAPAIMAIAAFLIAIANGGWHRLLANRPAAVAIGPTAIVASQSPARVSRLSLVLLPFASLPNDPSQDYFADGVTENLTTDLSRLTLAFVIARNSAFTYIERNVL